MNELLASIAKVLLRIRRSSRGNKTSRPKSTIVFHLHVAPDDMGRVIGKQGRIAKAIRTVMCCRYPPGNPGIRGNRLNYL